MANNQNAAKWNMEKVRSTLPRRTSSSHKGTYGTGLLIAGSARMPGAAMLAGLGAMRSGVGKLVIGTDPEVMAVIVPRLPEATYEQNGLGRIAEGKVDLSPYRAIAVGPGIVPNEQTEKAIDMLLAAEVPTVIDAGALSKRTYNGRKAPTILTPHLGEFSRMTDIAIHEIEQNRISLAKLWAHTWQTAIVLKGQDTVIAFPGGETWINPTGNSALAKGGTGDTLTGMLLGMLCIHDDWKHAVLNAVFLHGACADAWVETRSPHTLLAHELTDLLPHVWKRFE
ncbi:NAD(P)H-hydrate dehydratase [Planococcus sp. YIM B11945]|uniref:NAD(P)H-hydrate dehydratase n=1 Tax=Planococcus sp. YIM B11945 TaxID=3435410 RepID=UPI003D7E5761